LPSSNRSQIHSGIQNYRYFFDPDALFALLPLFFDQCVLKYPDGTAAIRAFICSGYTKTPADENGPYTRKQGQYL